MALLCVRNEDTTGHNGKMDFSLDSDGRLSRYTDGMDNPVVYAGAIAHAQPAFRRRAGRRLQPQHLFRRAIAERRLFGIVLEGHWLTVGTPEAIGEAEDAIRRFQTGG